MPRNLHIRLINPAMTISETLTNAQITSLNYCTSAQGVFDDTTPSQMSDAMNSYRSVCDSKSLALFFHGGLVDKASGMATAQQLFGPYSFLGTPAPQQGITADTWGNAYPYFVVWESGLLETLKNNLPQIIGEAIFRRVSDIVGQKALSIINSSATQPPEVAMAQRAPTLSVNPMSSVAPTPVATQADIDEVQRAVERDPIINAEKRRIAQTARDVVSALTESLKSPTRTVQTSPVTLLSPEIVNAIVGEESVRKHVESQQLEDFVSPIDLGSIALGAGKILIRIVQRYATRRNHNFHNTVVEEILRQYYLANIGASIWGEMKRSSADAFGADPNKFVGTRMIQELLKLYDSGPKGQQARVTLIGHSAGAIYIANFLAAMNQALQAKNYTVPIQFDVIFMAPAIRIDSFSESLTKYNHLIRNSRIFAMHDTLEAAEILIQIENPPNTTINPILAQIYTSSLLYFIAGVLEDDDDDTPLLGMERYLMGTDPFIPGAFPTIDQVKAFMARPGASWVYSDTGTLLPQPPLGMRSQSHHHGGFPIENGQVPGTGGTLESTCYLLRTGHY
jgi:hypothetical protein